MDHQTQSCLGTSATLTHQLSQADTFKSSSFPSLMDLEQQLPETLSTESSNSRCTTSRPNLPATSLNEPASTPPVTTHQYWEVTPEDHTATSFSETTNPAPPSRDSFDLSAPMDSGTSGQRPVIPHPSLNIYFRQTTRSYSALATKHKIRTPEPGKMMLNLEIKGLPETMPNGNQARRARVKIENYYLDPNSPEMKALNELCGAIRMKYANRMEEGQLKGPGEMRQQYSGYGQRFQPYSRPPYQNWKRW